VFVRAYAGLSIVVGECQRERAVRVSQKKRSIHPALVELGEERVRRVRNRVYDAITRLAVSMRSAYCIPPGLPASTIAADPIRWSLVAMSPQSSRTSRTHLPDSVFAMRIWVSRDRPSRQS